MLICGLDGTDCGLSRPVGIHKPAIVQPIGWRKRANYNQGETSMLPKSRLFGMLHRLLRVAARQSPRSVPSRSGLLWKRIDMLSRNLLEVQHPWATPARRAVSGICVLHVWLCRWVRALRNCAQRFVSQPDGEGRTVCDIVEAVEALPTVLECAGIPVPRRLQRRSLKPSLEGVRRYAPQP